MKNYKRAQDKRAPTIARNALRQKAPTTTRIAYILLRAPLVTEHTLFITAVVACTCIVLRLFLNVAKTTGFTKDIDVVVTDVMRMVHHLAS